MVRDIYLNERVYTRRQLHKALGRATMAAAIRLAAVTLLSKGGADQDTIRYEIERADRAVAIRNTFEDLLYR